MPTPTRFTRIDAKRLEQAGDDPLAIARLAAAVAESRDPITALTVNAAGTTQATATELTATFNVITVVTAAAAGVRLPATAEVGDELWIRNDDQSGTDTLNVFPHVGGFINSAVANASVAVANDRTAYARRMPDNTWFVLITAS